MKLYNTLTRKTDELVTIEKNKVRFYSCGLTVYSQPHIGNWVGYIYWDILTRVLEETGYEVNRVQNITDVGHLVSDDDNGEDKMEKGARAEGITAWEVAEKYIKIADKEGFELLGLKRPTLIRATDRIQEQIDFIKTLENKGYTYEIEDEGVYFDTSKLKDYGKLARLDVEGLKPGSRVEFKNKRNITDFALWKFSPSDKKRDMEWESPWGKGFPGWHLECSVIADSGLGEMIDIHAGGVDHIPIHHTNEIAQTEAVTGKPFAKFWIHNNHLKVDGGKMSKSLGNIYTLQDILDKVYSMQAFKLLILSKNYHTEGNFTWKILESAQNRLNNWQAVSDLRWQLDENSIDVSPKLIETLQDNLNTPEALKQIDAYFDTVSKKAEAPNKQVLSFIKRVLGIDLLKDDLKSEVKDLLKQRKRARDNQEWEKSDDVRDKLKEAGIEVKDSATGQIWHRI